jgi:hypothetical protein
MCCSSLRTCFGINLVFSATYRHFRRAPKLFHARYRIRHTKRRVPYQPQNNSSCKDEGVCFTFSFYALEANLDWVQSLPPRRCACIRLRLRVRGSRLSASRLRFPNQSSAPSRGRMTQRFFHFRSNPILVNPGKTFGREGLAPSPTAARFRTLTNSREERFPYPSQTNASNTRADSNPTLL